MGDQCDYSRLALRQGLSQGVPSASWVTGGDLPPVSGADRQAIRWASMWGPEARVKQNREFVHGRQIGFSQHAVNNRPRGAATFGQGHQGRCWVDVLTALLPCLLWFATASLHLRFV